jgi:hypothetical protein
MEETPGEPGCSDAEVVSDIEGFAVAGTIARSSSRTLGSIGSGRASTSDQESSTSGKRAFGQAHLVPAVI